MTAVLFLRFILSLASCKKCLVIDDQLNILPISSHAAGIEALPPQTPVSLPGPQEPGGGHIFCVGPPVVVANLLLPSFVVG